MSFSPKARRNLLATSAGADFAVALEIRHQDLAVPIRVVYGTEDLTIAVDDGTGTAVDAQFIACQFSLTPPDDVDQQNPKAQLSVTNIGRELTEWLEYSRGGKGAKCRTLYVMRSDAGSRGAWEFGAYSDALDPDYAMGYDIADWYPFEADFELDMSGISIDNIQVSADLGYQSTANVPAVAMRFDPATAPGLWG